MKILEKIHQIADIGKSTKELQSEISSSEAWPYLGYVKS
jgi:hypothetical protein